MVYFYEPIATPLTLTLPNCALFCKIQMTEVLASRDREDEKKVTYKLVYYRAQVI